MSALRKFPYWYVIAIPALLYTMGAASNQAVLIANHAKFPVMISEVQKEIMCSSKHIAPMRLLQIPDASCVNDGQFIDETHSIMGPNSRLKPLADIFPVGDGTYSIGDGLLFLAEWMFVFAPFVWLALTIKKLASLIP